MRGPNTFLCMCHREFVCERVSGREKESPRHCHHVAFYVNKYVLSLQLSLFIFKFFFLEMAIYCLWTIQRQYCMTAWHFQIRWDVLGRRFKISGPVGLAYISINPIYSYFIFKNMNSCWFPIATTGPLLFCWVNCSSFYSNNSQSCNYNNKIWHWCSSFWQHIYWNAIIHRFNKMIIITQYHCTHLSDFSPPSMLA